jgi:hypothetical protein
MDVLLAVLLILLGISLWALAGLLPVLSLVRETDGTATVTPQLTWMGAFVLWQQQVRKVRGARVVDDPANPQRSRVELITREGNVPLTGPYARGLAPARMAHIIDRFAQDRKIPPARLPLLGRMRLMTGFAILFPLGTSAIFVAVLLLLR